MIPLFTSDHSICDSVLTLSKDIYKKIEEEKDGKKVIRETDEVEISPEKPVSIFAIAKTYSLKQVFLVDSSLSSFLEAYKISKGLKLQVVFGLKIHVVDDMTRKDEASLKTVSNVIVFCKNSEGYRDLIKIFSKSHLEGSYYYARTDWKSLNEQWTPNLSLAIPFYSSFLAQNLLNFGHVAMPNFDKIGTPTFFLEEHGLPFDSMIAETLKTYAAANNYPIVDTHSVYYFKTADALSYQVLKCIHNRSTVAKPNLEHFGSDLFSFEEYINKTVKHDD